MATIKKTTKTTKKVTTPKTRKVITKKTSPMQKEVKSINKKITIKNINAISFGELFMIIAAIIGIFQMLSIISLGFLMEGGIDLNASNILVLIIFTPIVYGIIGFIIGFLSAKIYNKLVGLTGGLKISVN